MTTPLTLLQGLAPADTVVAVPARDAVDFLVALAAGSIAATLLAVLLLIVGILVEARRASRAIRSLREKVSAEPAVQSLRKTAGHVEEISDTLRHEVVKLSASFSLLSDRLTQASDRMEDRIEEFNALLEVMQAEAEEAFVEGASTARGVRAGIGSLKRARKNREPLPEEEESS